MSIALDEVVEIIAALGVPGLVLTVLMTVSPWYGAAAMTSSLAILGGPLGMVGGIAALPVLAVIARALAKFGFKVVFRAVLIDLKKRGKSEQEILKEIDSYPISKELKAKLREFIEKYSEENDDEENNVEDGEEEDSNEQRSN